MLKFFGNIWTDETVHRMIIILKAANCILLILFVYLFLTYFFYSVFYKYFQILKIIFGKCLFHLRSLLIELLSLVIVCLFVCFPPFLMIKNIKRKQCQPMGQFVIVTCAWCFTIKISEERRKRA